MSRPLRIEFAGALYHLTSRGNARGDIYQSDADRRYFLSLLNDVCDRFNWVCHAYCLMDNHYHLLIETGNANLSKGMRQLNGVYTQHFNRTYRRVGHLFQGRYKGILVDKDSYLLELSRYIVLNPVRARMIHSAEEWPWSSYRAMVGKCQPLGCLSTSSILSLFGDNKHNAQKAYEQFVRHGLNQPSPWEDLKNQIYLGPDAFIDEVQCKASEETNLDEIPNLQKRGTKKELPYYSQKYVNDDEAMVKAYKSGHYTMKEIGDYFGVSYSTVSRKIACFAQCKT